MEKNEVKAEVWAKLRENVLSEKKLIWDQPYFSEMVWPQNAITENKYRGVNPFILFSTGFKNQYWCTFNQSKKKGWWIPKPKEWTEIIFNGPQPVKDKKTGKPKLDHNGNPVVIWVFRIWRMYNVDQIDMPDSDREKFQPPKRKTENEQIQAAQEIWDGYVDRPELREDSSPYYHPKFDYIGIPPIDLFKSSQLYYATLFHEAAHSTGHSTRLDRALDTETRRFGDHLYSFEELVAEISSAFLCGHAQIEKEVIDNKSAYLQHWLEKLDNNPAMFVDACSHAQKVYDYIVRDEQKED